MRLCYGVFLFISAFELISGCAKKESDSPKPAKTVTPKPAPVANSSNGLYRTYHIDGASSLASLQKELGANGMQLVYKLNRRDLPHIKENENVLVPNRGDSELIYSPFPSQLDSAHSNGKLLVVSRRVQAFAAYDSGRLVKWGPTSTGKKATPTPDGLYHTNWKSKQTHSTVNGEWILNWYFNLDNLEGISLHEYQLPGYPASHSCVRLLEADAFWIYNWADQWKLAPGKDSVISQGTPVVVFGEYAYGKLPPWKKLFTDEHATTISEQELLSAINRYMPRMNNQASPH